MKAKIIRYERLGSLGNFEHEKISIELEIEDGETAQEVLSRAKIFINQNLIAKKKEYEDYKKAIINRDNMFCREADKALNTIREFETELPF